MWNGFSMRRPNQHQLYTRVENLFVPDSIISSYTAEKRTYRVHRQKYPVLAHVVWPSGRPCLAVNMYLIDSSHRWTGDSVVQAASKLTELVRYCASGREDRVPCGFGDLNDADFFRLADKLCSAVYVDAPSQRLRNNNTVRSILQESISFLLWYQKRLHRDPGRLIGEANDGAAITVVKKYNPHSQKYYWSHRYLPPRESTDPKLPIGGTMIEDIEASIEILEYSESYSERAIRRFSSDTELFKEHLIYLSARRRFVIFMMKTCGLRPGELCGMSVELNELSIRRENPLFVLPTLKRRKLAPPPRDFYITKKQARRAALYFRARIKWMGICERRGLKVAQESIFLSAQPGKLGKAVSKAAIEKEFERLCNHAGFEDQQSCLSMFRHRFITNEVRLHLKEWAMEKSELNKQDYRMLLERVRERTGHGSIDSLWSYIDLAREMDGVWDPVDAALRRVHAAEELNDELRDLRRELRAEGAARGSRVQLLELVMARLTDILSDARNAGLVVTPTR